LYIGLSEGQFDQWPSLSLWLLIGSGAGAQPVFPRGLKPWNSTRRAPVARFSGSRTVARTKIAFARMGDEERAEAD
jgi:hypothetical protein